MIVFEHGSIHIVQDNFHLIEEHWEEIVLNKEQRPLSVHWDWFYKAEKDGDTRTFVVRDNEEVVGYAVFIVHPHLHSSGLIIAQNDAVFMKKDKRVMSMGKAFLQYCDEELAKQGIKMIFWHVKPCRDFGPTLEGMGYELHEKIYSRFVGE